MYTTFIVIKNIDVFTLIVFYYINSYVLKLILGQNIE